jgi:predicted Fe-S protein YdhL (DUF1289 family)
MPMASGTSDALGDMAIDTPCVKVCEIDQATRLCTGCGRSLAEIAAWSTMSRDERWRVMRTLHERNAAGGKKVDAE